MLTSVDEDRMEAFEKVLFRVREAMALMAVWEVGVFDALTGGPLTPEELAAKTGTRAGKLTPFLDALCHERFLARQGAAYALVPGDERLFTEGKERMDSLFFTDTKSFFERQGQVIQVLKTGESIPAAGSGGDVSEEDRRSFLLYLHRRSLAVARESAQILSQGRIRSILDLGSGAGTYSMELLASHPRARARLVDRPNAEGVIRELAREYGVEDRVAFSPGEMREMDLGSGYDLVLMSNITHCYSPGWNQEMIGKAHRSLTPGGRLAIKDFHIAPDFLGPESGVWFRVNMAMFGNEGSVYPVGLLRGWMEEAGFTFLHTFGLREASDAQLLVARRPAEPIYHLIPVGTWEAVRGEDLYRPRSLSEEGFVHCSFERQVLQSADLHFAGQEPLAALVIDRETVAPFLRIEESRGGDRFPHIYGALPVSSITGFRRLTRDETGHYRWLDPR